ncbi:unnamed protein product [Rhizophagus irregularis]|nr:unnamed protein product [Rhizophagus irregularis]
MITSFLYIQFGSGNSNSKYGVASEMYEMYDAIKEGGSTRILDHLMRVPASNFRNKLSHTYLHIITKVLATEKFIA